MVEHATQRTIAITARTTLDGLLDQLRDLPPGSVTLALDPLSLLFATPDHFRALDAVRIARHLRVTFLVADPHRTGLALAFGYRVRSPGHDSIAPPTPQIERPHASPRTTDGLWVERDGANGEEVSAAAAIADSAPYEVRHTGRRRGWLLIASFALVIVFLVVGIGGSFTIQRVHTAAITLYPAEENFSRSVPFTVSTAPTSDPNAILTTVFETTLTREGDGSSTGKTTVPDGTAGGSVTFRSRADGAVTVKAGTTFKGQRDVSYVVQADVVVPGIDFLKGKLGEATGKVRATVPGPVGNLAAGLSAAYTDNVTFILGELTGGTEKQVPVITEDDITGVRSRLEADIRMRALNEVNTALPAGTTALNDYLTFRPVTVVSQPLVGTQTDAVHVRVSVPVQVPVYKNADFDALVERRLNDAVQEASRNASGPRRVLPETVEKSKPVFVEVQGSLVRYIATVSGRTRAIINDADIARIQRSLMGKDAPTATILLQSDTSLERFDVRYEPSWLPNRWLYRMPSDSKHIRIHLVST